MNLKQLADKVRDAVKGDEENLGTPPASPARPFDWDTPSPASFESVRAPKGAPEVPAPRPEPRPAPPREPARDAAPAPRPAAPRVPEIGRTSDVRLGNAAETTEAAGRAGRWKASATVPDLVTVYKEAGIESPLHGYGVDKLTEMLASPHLASAGREVRSTAVQVALEAARVPLRDIIDDALLRSKALAAFEADKAFDLQASQMRAERRAQVLRDQVDAFRRQKNEEIDELKRTIDAADSALAQLRARKRREEERLFRIVTHFVEARPAVAPSVARPAAATPAPPAATAAPRPATPTSTPPAAGATPASAPAATGTPPTRTSAAPSATAPMTTTPAAKPTPPAAISSPAATSSPSMASPTNASSPAGSSPTASAAAAGADAKSASASAKPPAPGESPSASPSTSGSGETSSPAKPGNER